MTRSEPLYRREYAEVLAPIDKLVLRKKGYILGAEGLYTSNPLESLPRHLLVSK